MKNTKLKMLKLLKEINQACHIERSEGRLQQTDSFFENYCPQLISL